MIDVWAGVEQSIIDNAIDNDADVAMRAHEPEEGILNIHCDKKLVRTFKLF